MAALPVSSVRARWRMVEIFTGAAALGWGLWLLWPPFGDSFSLSKGLSLLSSYAPENTWGTYFTVAGGLLLFGALTRIRLPALAGAFLVMWGRLFLAVLIGLATGWASAGVPDHTVWALMALTSLVRALGYEH